MPAFGARDRSYIIWDGFSGTLPPSVGGSGSTSWLFLYWNSPHSIVRNCNFTGNIVTTGNNSPIRIEQSNDNQVYNNYIHDSNSGYTNSAAIWIFEAVRAKVYNNTIINTWNGIFQKTGPNIDNEYYRNLIINSGQHGIHVVEQAPGGGGIKIYQNIVVNSGGASIYASLGLFPSSSYISDYQIYNNTSYNGRDGLITDEGEGSSIAQFRNNIIYASSRAALRYYSGSALPVHSDYNGFYPAPPTFNLNWATNHTGLTAWQAATNRDTHSMVGNPLFANGGGRTARDYLLSLGSPFIGAGLGGVDLGAYPNGDDGTAIGWTPSPPANLRLL